MPTLHPSPQPAVRPDLRLYAVIVCFWSSMYLYVPIMAPFAEYRGASLQTVGFLVSAYGLTQLLLRIPLGIWSDRVGKRRPFIMYGFVAALAGACGMGFIGNPHVMILFRGLTGVCASMWVMLSVWYASGFDAAQTGRATGMAMFVANSTQLVANLGGGLLAESLGWEAPFVGAALLAVIGFLLTSTLQDAPPRSGTPPQVSELLGMGRDRHLVTVSLLAALLQCMPYITVYGFTSVYATAMGATKAQLGILTFSAGAATALCSYLSSFFTSKLGARKVVLGGFTLAGAGALLFPFAANVALLTACQIVVSSGQGLVFPTLMGLSIASVPNERRATAMGFFQSLYSLGMFSGPVVGGFLGQRFGLEAAFVGAGLIAFIGAVGTWLFLQAPVRLKRERRTATHADG